MGRYPSGLGGRPGGAVDAQLAHDFSVGAAGDKPVAASQDLCEAGQQSLYPCPPRLLAADGSAPTCLTRFCRPAAMVVAPPAPEASQALEEAGKTFAKREGRRRTGRTAGEAGRPLRQRCGKPP